MSKCKDYICDICERHIEPYANTRFKVQSSRFVDWVNYEDWNVDKQTWDICLDCLTEIKKRVNKTKKENKNEL